jgi:GxxExxY protein
VTDLRLGGLVRDVPSSAAMSLAYFDHDPLTFRIIGAAMEVHRRLGCGFLEAVYREALAIEFLERGIPFETEHSWPIVYRDIVLPLRYRVDFFCFGAVIVEVKALAELGRLERNQAVNYVRMARTERGLLLNFGGVSLQYRRIVSRWRE